LPDLDLVASGSAVASSPRDALATAVFEAEGDDRTAVL
jgi:hypothetical protein